MRQSMMGNTRLKKVPAETDGKLKFSIRLCLMRAQEFPNNNLLFYEMI